MKKKIIFYGINYYPPKGGTSRVAENLILQLKDKFNITIYCYNHPQAKTHIPGVTVVEFRQLANGSVGSLLYFLLSALHILFFSKGDLVHAHKTDCAIFLPLIRLRYKVVATSHEAPYKRDKWNGFQKAYFRLAEKIFVRSATICTCISKPLSDYYQARFQRQVRYIPNGINITEPAQFDHEKALSFLPVGASMDRPYILFGARRLMSTKGCHTMLVALHRIAYHGQVFIAGELEENPYLEKLRSLAQGLNVFFLGFAEPLNALLALVQSSDLFIFPSETEGMSIMLLEVASVGQPIIASDIPENTVIFSDSEVIYFKCGDAGDLAQKITNALSDNEHLKTFGENAQKQVYAHYLWSDIALEYAAIYQQILGKINPLAQVKKIS